MLSECSLRYRAISPVLAVTQTLHFCKTPTRTHLQFRCFGDLKEHSHILNPMNGVRVKVTGHAVVSENRPRTRDSSHVRQPETFERGGLKIGGLRIVRKKDEYHLQRLCMTLARHPGSSFQWKPSGGVVLVSCAVPQLRDLSLASEAFSVENTCSIVQLHESMFLI